MGSRSVYMDNANEAHNVIILKHFMEKNRAVVVDVKTRKRKAGSVSLSLNQLLHPTHCILPPSQKTQENKSGFSIYLFFGGGDVGCDARVVCVAVITLYRQNKECPLI